MTDTSLAKRLSLISACIGFAIVILDVSVVNVALNEVQRELGADISGLEWVVNGYTLTFAAFLLTAGALSDRYGAKRVFQVGFIVFGASSLACSLAGDLVTLIGARIVQGVGAATLVPASLAIVNQTFQDRSERSRAVSLWAAAGGLALALGPVIGGLLILQSGWRLIFMVNVPIAAIGVWVAAATAPSAARHARRKVDWLGQITAVASLGGMTMAIIEVGRVPWHDPLVLIGLVLFLGGGALFVLTQSRSVQPMLPMSIFHNSSFTFSSMIGVGVNFAFYGLIFMYSLLFQSEWGYSPMQTGLTFLPMTAAILVGNLAAGRLMGRFGPRPVLVGGLFIAAFGYIAMLPAIGSATFVAFAAQFIIAGLGIGLAVPSMTTAMLSAVDPDHVGVASGVLNASRQIGGLLGVATTGLLLQGHSAGALTHALPQALCIACLFLVASGYLALTRIAPTSGGTRETATAGRVKIERAR